MYISKKSCAALTVHSKVNNHSSSVLDLVTTPRGILPIYDKPLFAKRPSKNSNETYDLFLFIHFAKILLPLI